MNNEYNKIYILRTEFETFQEILRKRDNEFMLFIQRISETNRQLNEIVYKNNVHDEYKSMGSIGSKK